MADDDGGKKDEARERLAKRKRLEQDLSGALMSGRIAARTETRVRVKKAEVDQADTQVNAAAVPQPEPTPQAKPPPTRNPGQPPTSVRRAPPTGRAPGPGPGQKIANLPPKKAPAPPRRAPAKAEAPAKAAAPAKTEGNKKVAWDPKRLTQFITGVITLGELEGISKEEQYEMAALGHRNLQAGKLDAARKVFEGLVALDPKDAYFHLVLGSVAQRQDRNADAIKSYSRAITLDASAPHAYANRGEVRMLEGDMVEGAKDLLRACELDPDARHESTRRARATISVVMQQLEAKKQAAAPKPAERPERSSPAPRRPEIGRAHV